MTGICRAAGYTSSALLALACARTPQATVVGSSVSGQQLTDATQLVLVVDAARAPNCSEQREITVEPVEGERENIVAERWKVERCGSVKFYRVRLTPNFSVQEEDTPAIKGRPPRRFTPP